MLAVFPEGHKGTGKPFRDRYRLCPFNVGFLELSLLCKAPIVPTAVIGAEEQYPMTFNLRPVARWLKFPYLPVPPLLFLLGPLGVLPLPTKYLILYGEPLHLYREYPPETVRDPRTIRTLADTVRNAVQKLVLQGLSQRKGVFGVPVSGVKGAVRAARERLLGRADPRSEQPALGDAEPAEPASTPANEACRVPDEFEGGSPAYGSRDERLIASIQTCLRQRDHAEGEAWAGALLPPPESRRFHTRRPSPESVRRG